jgi:hypothetical protein
MFATTSHSPPTGNPTVGGLYKLPIGPDGRPGALEMFWESRPFDGPDGFAIARSGNVYLALAGSSQLVRISPAGVETARIPEPGNQPDPPFDGPASVAFAGQSALVTNQSYPAGNPDHWVVFDVFTGEAGLPLFRPRIGADGAPGTGRLRVRLRLVFERGRDARGRRCAIGRVRASVKGRDRGRVRAVTFRFDGRRVARDRRPPFTAIVYRPRPDRARVHRVVARVSAGRRARVLRARVRTCARRAAVPAFTG